MCDVAPAGAVAKGHVTVVRHPDQERRLDQMLALVDDLRDALHEAREEVGSHHLPIRESLDELERALEALEPLDRLRAQVSALGELVSGHQTPARLARELAAMMDEPGTRT